MNRVAVVGAGAAGLVAALAAARAGARVVLLDKEDGTASDLAVSGGLIPAAGTPQQAAAGIVDDASIWTADIARATGDTADATVTRCVTRHAAEALRFVAGICAVEPRLVSDIIFPGHSVPRLHALGGFAGKAMADALLDAVRAEPGIEFRTGTPVEDLLFGGGRVTGVVTVQGELAASATVLACGGYGASQALLARFLPDMVGAPYIGSEASDGKLLAALIDRGVPVRDMQSYQGHGHATVVGVGRLGAGLTTIGALLVNRDGRRFVNEEIGPSGLAAHVRAQPGRSAIEIYTDAMHQSFLRFASYAQAVERGAARQFADVAQLAAYHGVDAAQLSATLVAFNRAARGEAGDDLGRRDFKGPVEAPLWAVEVTAALVHTQGGLTIDAGTGIRGKSGVAIGGLFGAGGAVVGMTGSSPAGYMPGNGLAQAVTLGYLAGRQAARAAMAET